MKIVILHDDTHLFAGQKDFTSEAAQAVWSRLGGRWSKNPKIDRHRCAVVI